MDSLKEISKQIKKSNSIAIFTHVSPDCDALGSSCALMTALNKMNIKTNLFIKEPLTHDQTKLFSENKILNTECDVSNYDLFIATDVSALNRLGEYSTIFNNSNNTIVLDHHYCDKKIGKFNYIDNNSSSACEIVFSLLKELKVDIDSEIATMLFVGISADTSSFQNSNTNSKSYLNAYELCKLKADIVKANQILYENKTEKEIKFEKYLLNNYKIIKNCAYIAIDKKILKKLNGGKADCSSFSRKLVSIENIIYGFSLVEEENGLFGLSLRAKDGYNVKIIAEKFGGGGHICASGAKFHAKNIKEATQKVLEAFNK